MWIPSDVTQIDEDLLKEHFGLRRDKLAQVREKAKQAILNTQKNFLKRQESKRRPKIYQVGQQVLIKQHRASKWAPKYDGPFKVTKVISESVLEVQHLESGRQDTIHIDYVRPYFSRDGSPAIGQNAHFPEEKDERSDNLYYEERLLSDETDMDIVVEADSHTVPSSIKPDQGSAFSDNVRMTRSKTRALKESENAYSKHALENVDVNQDVSRSRATTSSRQHKSFV
jgi:hypothetical protein